MTLNEIKKISKEDLEISTFLSQQLYKYVEIEKNLGDFFIAYSSVVPSLNASVFLYQKFAQKNTIHFDSPIYHDLGLVYCFATKKHTIPKDELILALNQQQEVIQTIEKKNEITLLFKKKDIGGIIINFNESSILGVKNIDCLIPLFDQIINKYCRVTNNFDSTNKIIAGSRISIQNPYPTLRFSKDGDLLFSNEAAIPIKDHFDELKWVYQSMFDECIKRNESKKYEQVINNNHYSITITPVPGQLFVNVYAMDISSRKNIEIKLKEEKEKAEKIAQLKMEFLSTMSHEIRTPMNSIIGSINLLIGTQLDPYQEKKLSMMRFAADNLLRLINEILDLNKLEANKVSLEKIRFSLPETMEHLFSMYADKAEEKNIGYQLDVNKLPISFVIGDPTRLSQILLNLLSNAIKFTQKGAVSLKVKSTFQNNDTIVYQFTIQDSGIGISKDRINSIFEAFTQAEASTTRKFGGTGLGLSITKKLVDLLEGQLLVDSKEGEGTSFSIKLPFTISKDQSIEKKKENIIKIDGNLKGKKVLLVDDNEFNIIIASEFLKRWEADISIAKNGQEAIDKVFSKNSKFDIILMDLQMPVMDGFEATAQIRHKTDKYFQNIPIIALTADVTSEEVDEIIKKGFNDLASKPFDPEKLLGNLLQLIEKNTA